MFKLLLMIGAGGFLGAVCRYFVSNLLSKWTILSMPTATFVVNVFGSLALGYIYGADYFTNEQITFLSVGFLASFTTFSTFNFELLQLKEGGKAPQFFIYGAAMYVTCIVAAVWGFLWGSG